LVDFKERVEVGEPQKFRLANLAEKNVAEVLVLDPLGNKINVCRDWSQKFILI
jgi:hypothetical protein